MADTEDREPDSYEEALYLIVQDLAQHFNAGRDYRFGSDILIHLADNLPSDNDDKDFLRKVRRQLRIADPDDPEKSTFTSSLMMSSTMWEMYWMLEYARSFNIGNNAYTPDKAAQLLIDGGFYGKMNEADLLYTDIRNIYAFHVSWQSSDLALMEIWYRQLDRRLLEDVCNVIGIEDIEKMLCEITLSISNDFRLGAYLVNCDRVGIRHLRDLIILINYHCSNDVFEDTMRKYIADVTGNQYEDINQATRDYINLGEELPEKQTHKKLVETLMNQGLANDWEAYRNGVPLEDILI